MWWWGEIDKFVNDNVHAIQHIYSSSCFSANYVVCHFKAAYPFV